MAPSPQEMDIDATGELTDGLATYLHDDTNYDGDWQDDEDYDYDDNGNRTSGGYTTGLHNRMTSDGTYTYEYDAEGNRTKRYVAGSPDTDVTEYEWDHRNRLVKITERAAAGGAATKIIEYYYDHENRWVRKVLDSDGDTDTDASTIFVYDGKQIVLQFDDDDDQDLAAGDLSHRYLWGPAVDQVLVDEQVSSLSTPGARYWPLSDHLGSVRDVIDDDADVQLHRIYDAFGNIVESAPANITHLFAFTARPLDEDSGLQNNLNRWYDLSTGRWMSEDPIGFDAPGVNLYCYVRNRLLVATDPLGLMQQTRSVSAVKWGKDVYLHCVLLVDKVPSSSGDVQLRVRVRVRRPVELPNFRDTWNDLQYEVDDSWDREVWNTDDESSEDRWLWPNLSMLFNRDAGYGGWDPGKEVWNDYAAVLIRRYERVSQDASASWTEHPNTKDSPLISSAWHAIGGEGPGYRDVSHVAGAEEFRLTPKKCESGMYRIWWVMADTFGHRGLGPYCEGPEDNSGFSAGGVLAYFELRFAYWNSQSSLMWSTKSVSKDVPGTGFDWDAWDENSRLREDDEN